MLLSSFQAQTPPRFSVSHWLALSDFVCRSGAGLAGAQSIHANVYATQVLYYSRFSRRSIEANNARFAGVNAANLLI